MKDLTGQRFGKLAVIKKADKPVGSKRNHLFWLCKCDCGNEKVINGGDLKSGVKSCGCLTHESPYNFQDLTGKKFGRLLVIKRVNKPKEKSAAGTYWLCKCDCGNEKTANNHDLVHGDTTSCGCKRHETPYNFIDLTGQRFGRLIVIERENKKNNHTRWLCKCDCGNMVMVDPNNLKKGTSTSCGCYQKEVASLPYGEAAMNKLLSSYIRHAKTRNISFELSKEEFFELTKRNCFYCGKEPSYITKTRWGHGNYIYNGVDRIDSSKGYTIENTVSCCGKCNQAKMAETQEDFLNWVERVYNHSIKDKK
jgi:hypothetical protein